MRDYERLIVTTVVHCAYIIVFIYLCIYFYLYIFGVCSTKTLPFLDLLGILYHTTMDRKGISVDAILSAAHSFDYLHAECMLLQVKIFLCPCNCNSTNSN